MELRRGKTFIKSSAQHEKVPPVHAAPTNKDHTGKVKKASVEGNQSVAEVQLACLATHKNYRFSTRAAKNGAGDNSLEKSSGSSYKLVRKSKTHECVTEADKTEQCSPSSRAWEEGFPGKGKGRLVNSVSFSGMSSSSSKKECVVSPSQSACSSQMIDYRNFVPQMPFVPAVAKTIPRKRISLKRSKKGLRDIFHIKKNKPESLTFLVEKDKNLSSPGCKSELSGHLAKYLFKTGETFATDCLSQDCSDTELQSDSSYDCCNTLCEDVASLKSFDSLTGCGEIFADESSAHVELENSKEILLRRSKHKDNPVMGSFQGGVEQLASPGQNETVEFAKFWDNINKSVRLHQSALFDKNLLKMPGAGVEEARSQAAASVTDQQVSSEKDGDDSKESSTETGTPKSDNQESTSTSDEGYYDSFSPGQDDETKQAQTPEVPGKFPRDSYSGDALYELFYDPNEVKINPVLDDDLCTSESISEQAIEIPLSIYSFHVGAEENMASQPALDIISQGFFHSTWKGKECLLKLCDTELSLTMGIINWLRKHSGLVSSPDSLQNPQPQPEKSSDSLIPPSPSPEQKASTEARQEKQSKEEFNTLNQRILLDESKHATQISSANIAEREHSLDASSNTSNLDVQGREGSPHKDSSTVPGTVETTRTSSYAPQPHANGVKLQVPSTENERETISEGCDTCGDKKTLPEKLNRESASQSSENPSLDDNHEVESCYSFKTAATSLLDPLEREDRNKPTYHSLSVSCDKPLQPFALTHFQSYISPTPPESSTDIVQLLERCVTQVASLKISYENRYLEDKCIGNEMNNIIHKMSQYKTKLLLQNECNCGAPNLEYSSIPSTNQYNYETSFRSSCLYHLKQNGEQIGSENQKSRAKILDEVTRSKINFEYAQLNNQALSYLKDFTFDLSPSNTVPALSRPTFLPLFNSACSDIPAAFLQASHSPAASLGEELQLEEDEDGSGRWRSAESPCGGMAAVSALSPHPEAVTPDTAVTGTNHQ
ncbi:APC membrane recruitment protein 3 [Cuculus canorus]|uniref:APC membrane recruitment protein 3 n=1 Tax=Cuculus canorus TaxID=55661 RepID=UPI0023AA6275|nr:APC membrane recruitment protein 3 [Cuculus canorus]XP_053930538.1 APC membrane recruitment protein 3 [Cuculus canorus]XP_053930539.1 APC membrane recruitment protein 3 [Cuculus canorus]XP_053930540.1 APC membrane recruitment protein 3 [Cuculus canorus]XP_053930541.1 APC membrane recruitment protein 3 [Cuculus canorus]